MLTELIIVLRFRLDRPSLYGPGRSHQKSAEGKQYKRVLAVALIYSLTSNPAYGFFSFSRRHGNVFVQQHWQWKWSSHNRRNRWGFVYVSTYAFPIHFYDFCVSYDSMLFLFQSTYLPMVHLPRKNWKNITTWREYFTLSFGLLPIHLRLFPHRPFRHQKTQLLCICLRL